jgi:hypothetical protein
MSTIELDQRRLLRMFLSILAALLVLAATQRAVWAEGHIFIVPAASGYGVSDCLGKAQGCSEIVASAWCEAHGYSGPLAFGKAEDITGTIPVPVSTAVHGALQATIAATEPAKIDPNAFIVTCGD